MHIPVINMFLYTCHLSRILFPLLLFFSFIFAADPSTEPLVDLIRRIGRQETRLARQVQASDAEGVPAETLAATLDSLKNTLRTRVAGRIDTDSGVLDAELERSLQEFPGSPLLLSLLADVYAERGRLAEAADLYRQALSADASQTVLQTKLAGVLVRLDKDEAALRIYRITAEQTPEDPSCLKTCLDLAERTSRLEEVARRWEILVRLHPGYSVMRRHLIAAWNRLGRNDKVAALTGDGGDHE